MTTAAAIQLIRDSAPYKNAGGVLDMAWTRWALANEGEATKLEKFVAGETGPPSLSTKFGRGWVALLSGPDGVAAPSPAPVPEPGSVRTPPILGAIVVNAQAVWDQENAFGHLRAVGCAHVAPQIEPWDETVANNFEAFDDGMLEWFRGKGFRTGGLSIHYFDPIGEAERLAPLVRKHALSFLVCDTERHKADQARGSKELTAILFAALRTKLGAVFPLFNVTFGIHSSPAVVNHDAFRRHNVTPIWEAYDGAGVTLGVHRTVAKAELEGWNHQHVALGDKSLPADARDLADLRLITGRVLTLGGVWLWAPEQAGDTVLALRGLA